MQSSSALNSNNSFKNQSNGSKVGKSLPAEESLITIPSTFSSISNNKLFPRSSHCSQPLISSSSKVEVIKATDFTVVKSHVTRYHSVRVDLPPTKTIRYSFDNLSCLTPVTITPTCETIHHGHCSSAVKLNCPKAVVTYPVVTSPPSQSSDYAIFSYSRESSEKSFIFDEEDDKSIVVPPEIPPRTCSHLNHKSPFEILSQSSHHQPNCTIGSLVNQTSQSNQLQELKQILSADTILEDQLQQLLFEFVKEEKMRQESKSMKKGSPLSPFSSSSLGDRRSLSMSSLNSIPQQQPNYGPTDYYIRGRSSHNSSPKVIDSHHHRPNFLFNLFNRSFSIPSSNSSQVKVNPSQGSQVRSIDQEKEQKSPSVTRKALSTNSIQKQIEVNEVKTATLPSHVLKSGSKLVEQQMQQQPSGKMVFGLSDKTPKGKYIDMANNRQGMSGGGSTPKITSAIGSPQVPSRGVTKSLSRSTEQLSATPTSSGLTITDPNSAPVNGIGSGTEGKVVKKKVKRSNSLEEKGEERKKKGESKKVINVMNNPFEQVLNEVLQLTDDEKACILASHQQSLNQTLKQQRKEDFVQQQQLLLESKLRPKSINPSNSINPHQHTNLNKKKSFSSDSLSNKKLLVDFESMINNPTAINYSNPIDYARTRFVNSVVSSSKNPSLPSFIDFNHPALKQPTQALVNEVKSKWEPIKMVNNLNNNQTPKEKSNKLTASQRRLLNLNDPAKNPVKPFLSRGSVAERVLLFEKCPEVKSTRVLRDHRKSKSHVLYNTWRGSHFSDDNQNEPDKGTRELVRRKSRAGTSCKNSLSPGDLSIPKFYFPHGRPYTSLEIEEKIKKIKGEFEKLPAKCILSKLEMTRIVKACDVPLYWKEPIRLAVLAARTSGNNGNSNQNQNQNTATSNQNPGASTLNLNEITPAPTPPDSNKITCHEFLDFWKRLLASSYEESCRFVKLLTKGERNYLVHDDFIPMIQDVVESHPGLLFLKDAIEFHSRYVHTVIARIFYCVNKSWSGKITIPELRKSNFLSVVSALEEEDDINQITDYFSYEHFYVIYCKFWELDKDHDLIIDKHDLTKHNDGTISARMIDRIFSGAVTRGPVHKYGKMTYTEFVWFLIAEEDKRHPRSIEYWFRCMDLDGDGYLSMFELEYFYSDQVRRMDAMGIEALPFNDALCQMLDMVSPENPGKISLADLKRCRMTAVFFDTFFNLDKYLDHEQRDPFASNKNEEEMSDWDKFAAEEYELLVAEENVNQPGKGGRSNSLM